MEVSRAVAEVLRHDSDKKVWFSQEELSANLEEFRKCQHNDQGVVQTMVNDVLQDGTGPKKRERFVVENRSDRSSRVAATKKAKSGKGSQDVKMKDATKEGREDEESSGKEVSTSWRCSESEDGVLLINVALGEGGSSSCEIRSSVESRWRNRKSKNNQEWSLHD